jgi:hypothetical protein
MSAQGRSKTEAAPPHVQLIQMGTAFWVSRVVYAAAKLGLADHLATGPKSAVQLAGLTGTHAPSLYRLMRTIASLGVLTEDAQHRFALTPLGESLKAGAPGSARASILIEAGDLHWRLWEQFLYSIETGKTAADKLLGKSGFEYLTDYLAENPEEASLFNEAMIGFHGAEAPAVAAAYDFSRFQTIVDVGGGTGNLLATVLEHHDGPAGVLFDLPHVVHEAPAMIQARGLLNRITVQAGDFFQSVPVGGEAYLLSHVIHDWGDEQCRTILRNCRNAMKPDGRLLIIEMVLPAGDAPHPGKLLDMLMLVATGGRERTEEEYRKLLNETGLRLRQVVPTESAVSIVEAIVA